jgi:methyltransferase family protein/putative zinc binding protein/C-methyltransferase-like protein
MISSLKEIETCEVCGNARLLPALNLGLHPICDDLVPIGDPRQCKTYPIEILFCDICRTAHQRFQISKDQLFPPTYHYRSRQTADVLSGMRQLVEACSDQIGPLNSLKVLDIGCNDGSLLSFFKERGAVTYGIEPTNAADDAAKLGHITIKDFLSENVASQFVRAHGHPDLITFTNVFAHIEDLPAVLRAVRVLKSPTTFLVIENHYLGAIIERHQFDTFYHEHPRTYSFKSLARIADALAMYVAKAEFPNRYGGNIRVFIKAREFAPGAAHDQQSVIESEERSFGERLMRLSTQVDLWRTSKLAAIGAEVATAGRLRAKAFPGRAAIPVRLLNLTENVLEGAYEKPGSPKISHYIPGTRIPILSDEEFSFSTREQPQRILNLAWHIRPEIESYLRGLGFRGRIIDIISQDDFLDTGR